MKQLNISNEKTTLRTSGYISWPTPETNGTVYIKGEELRTDAWTYNFTLSDLLLADLASREFDSELLSDNLPADCDLEKLTELINEYLHSQADFITENDILNVELSPYFEGLNEQHFVGYKYCMDIQLDLTQVFHEYNEYAQDLEPDMEV